MEIGLIVYGLIDPVINIIRYIGKSSKGWIRPKEHVSGWICPTDRTRRANWIRKLRKINLQPQIIILEKYGTEEECSEGEILWIARMRKEKIDLVNLTDGGDGISGLKHTEKTKRKLRQKRKEQIPHRFTEEQKRRMSKAAKGKPKSIEHRKKISETMKDRIIPRDQRVKMITALRQPEVREKIANSLRGRSPSIETRRKISESNIGKHNIPKSAECKAKMSRLSMGRKHSEETKQKISQALKGIKRSPEFCEKIKQSWALRKEEFV